jgi:plastocyanin
MRPLRLALHLCLPALMAPLVLLAPAGASAATVIVEMRTVNAHPVFLPAEVTIEPGDTVRWINLDQQLEHSTCSGSGMADPAHGALWQSDLLRFGEYFEYTFPAAGDYAYFSIPHEYEGMLGLVRVDSGTSVAGPEYSTWGKIKNRFAEILPRD